MLEKQTIAQLGHHWNVSNAMPPAHRQLSKITNRLLAKTLLWHCLLTITTISIIIVSIVIVIDIVFSFSACSRENDRLPNMTMAKTRKQEP